MTKAAELAKMGEVLTNSQIGGRRNILINGAMQVAQRHTTTTDSNGFPVDRFKASVGNMAQLAQTLNQNTVSDLSGFTKSIKITTTTPETELTGGKLFRITYSAEGLDLQQLKKGTSDAEKLTLTFYVKSSITGTYAITFFDDSNSRIIGTTYTISSANTWEKKTILIAADTTGTITNDNTQGFKINWILGTGPSFTGTDNSSWGAYADGKLANGHTAAVITTNGATWELTGVQLEVGSVATPFEHRSFGEELGLCQRYYYVLGEGSGERMGTGGYYSSSGMQFPVRHPVEMRATPTAEVVTGTGYYLTNGASSDAHNSISIDGATKRSTSFYNSSEASGTAGDHAIFLTANASAKVALLSEL